MSATVACGVFGAEGLRVMHRTVASNVERFAPEGIATHRPESGKGK